MPRALDFVWCCYRSPKVAVLFTKQSLPLWRRTYWSEHCSLNSLKWRGWILSSEQTVHLTLFASATLSLSLSLSLYCRHPNQLDSFSTFVSPNRRIGQTACLTLVCLVKFTVNRLNRIGLTVSTQRTQFNRLCWIDSILALRCYSTSSMIDYSHYIVKQAVAEVRHRSASVRVNKSIFIQIQIGIALWNYILELHCRRIVQFHQLAGRAW